jgi:cell division septal protein FtsQ
VPSSSTPTASRRKGPGGELRHVAENSATTADGTALSRGNPSLSPLARLLPSGRSLAVGFVLLIGGILAYVVARQTSAFALRAVEVRGAPPALEREVRTALRPLHGRNLLALEPSEIEKRLAALPAVGSASFDRAFPHTLRIVVAPERAVAVLRSGRRAWLLSSHAKVLRSLAARPLPQLPRIWVPKSVQPRVGFVPGDTGLTRATALVARAARADPKLAKRISTVRAEDGRVTFVLRSGTELRLGSVAQLSLKLAVAARLLAVLPASERERLDYIDLSVPTRPVAG